MSYCSVTIYSENLSGQTVDVTYYPTSGGTIDLGPQVIPFTYVSDYYWGTYDCYSSTYDYTYTIVVPENPTPTPTLTPDFTPTLTPTITPTITITPTLTKSPTPTPQIIYQLNLWVDGLYNIACDYAAGPDIEPSNITIYTTKPFTSLDVGDVIYGNGTLSIPPSSVNGNTISDGAIWVQFNSGSGEILVTGICP